MNAFGVTLTPLLPSDFDLVYQLSVDPSSGATYRYRGTTPSPEFVHRQLYEGVFAQYAVRDASSGAFRGLVCLYNANALSGYAWLSVLGPVNGGGDPSVVLGALLLLQRAFEFWQFRKIYIETLEPIAGRLNSGLARFGKEEGRLREHERLGGDVMDLVTIAIRREEWPAIGSAYLREMG